MGKIIDFFMRRKPLFLTLLFLFGLSSASSCLALRHNFLQSNPTSLDEQPAVASIAPPNQNSIELIANYQQSIPNYVLENKNLDSTTKSEILSSYYQLDSEQQKPFNNFIAALQRGGVPRLSYIGKTAYPLNTDLQLATLINAYDNEDGSIEFNDRNLKIDSELDTSKVGSYDVVYTAHDQDLNSATLTVQIQIYDPNSSTDKTTSRASDNALPSETSEKTKSYDTNGQNSSEQGTSTAIEVPALGNVASQDDNSAHNRENNVLGDLENFAAQNTNSTSGLTGAGINKFAHTTLAATGIFQAALQQEPDASSANLDPLATVLLITAFVALALLIRFVIVHYLR